MRILALETSSTRGSVAALDGDRLLAELPTADSGGTAQTLAPAISELLSQAGWTATDPQLIAVTQGPGSFTGLRVGVTTAKTFAYATRTPVVGIHTLQVIATQVELEASTVWAVLDAQRQQLFAAAFKVGGGVAEFLRPTAIIDRLEFIAQLQEQDLVTGPGIEPLMGDLSRSVKLVDRSSWYPQAATVGRIAAQCPGDMDPDTLWSLAPNYYRKSAAEEKLAPDSR